MYIKNKLLLILLAFISLFWFVWYFFYSSFINVWDIVFRSKDAWFKIFIDADFSSFSSSLECGKVCTFKEIPSWKYNFYASIKWKEDFYWTFNIEKNKKKFKNLSFENIVSLEKINSNIDIEQEFSFKKNVNKYDLYHFNKKIYSFIWSNLDETYIDKIYPFSWDYVFSKWNNVVIFNLEKELFSFKIENFSYIKKNNWSFYIVTDRWVFLINWNNLEYKRIFDDFIVDFSWKYIWIIYPWKSNDIVSNISNSYRIVSYSPVSKNHKILLDTREKVDKIFVEDWEIKISNQNWELLIINL